MTLKFDSIEKDGKDAKIIFRKEGGIVSATTFFEGAAGEKPTILESVDVLEFATMDYAHNRISYEDRKNAAVAIIMHDVKIG